MNQNRSLPDKYYGENGIHRVPVWRIAGFAMNNASTNMYMFLMMYVSYYLGGWVGVATVAAGSFTMMMRIWDAVTDPIVGMVVDKTNGKFGKNRPFMVLGNAILFITSYIMFNFTHKLPMAARFPFFVVMAAIFYVGYTMQCIVTKSAQTCMTNDPKQRPLFAVFDGAFVTVLYTLLAMIAVQLSNKYGGFLTDPALYGEMQLMFGFASAIMCAVAVFSIAPKDRTEFYGTGQANQKIAVKDYIDTICHNRALQMLVISAGTDKLSSSMKGATALQIVLFGIVVGNYSLSATMQGIISIPTVIIMMLFVGGLATKLGQMKAMVIGSWGGIITNAMLILLWIFGDYKSMSAADGSLNWGLFTILYVVLNIAMGGFTGLSGNIVIPMTADCADYEVYRTGKYMPGIIGTLFSFVDKMISSFGTLFVSLMFAAIGFTETLPDLTSPYSNEMFYITLFCLYGSLIIGNICNVIAMRFYPLTKEKMEEIQDKIAAIKAQA